MFISKVLYVAHHDSKSHMWTSSTMMDYLDFLGVQIRAKRMALGLTAKDRCLVLCDKATQHHSEIYERVRAKWELQHNAIIVHGQSSTTHGISIPGGWGACGGPNDGFHQFFHTLRRSYQRVRASLGGGIQTRKVLSEMKIAVDGGNRMESPSLEQR